MTRFFWAAMVATFILPHFAIAEERQVLELRTYTLTSATAEEKLDAYLQYALIPALQRQGLGPIGAFDQAKPTAEGPIQVLLLISGPSAEAVTEATAKLTTDSEYQQAAEVYLARPADEPGIKRISSELLRSFDGWPRVKVPNQKQAGRDRLFELRTYESATEKLGELKVEMFNSGEVPIFLASGIAPVFMGQALIGDKLPNLTYMTVYDDETKRDAAWKKFIEHADWKAFSTDPKWKDTVSKIHKSDWKPKSYSEL